MASPNVGQLIDLLATIPAKEHENALSYVMSEWVMHQGKSLRVVLGLNRVQTRHLLCTAC